MVRAPVEGSWTRGDAGMSYAASESALRRLHNYEVAQLGNHYPVPLGPLTTGECEQIATARHLARTVALNRQLNQQLRYRLP